MVRVLMNAIMCLDLAGGSRVVTHPCKPKWPLPAGSRTAGRHREIGVRPAPQVPPLVNGQGGGGLEETIRLVFPEPEPWRQRRGWRRVLAVIRGPVLAWIAAAAILGGFALLGVIGGSGGTMAQNQIQLPAMVPAPVTVPSSTAAPSAARHRHRPRRTAATATRAPRQPGPATPTASALAPTPASHPSAASPHRDAPAVQVKYLVDGTSGGGFQGEVDVVNNGRQPLAGWQIVVALEGDEVTAVHNASGLASNGILLMQPANSTEVVPPDGGTLRVFFAAQGPRTTPLACAFNQVNCQLPAAALMPAAASTPTGPVTVTTGSGHLTAPRAPAEDTRSRMMAAFGTTCLMAVGQRQIRTHR